MNEKQSYEINEVLVKEALVSIAQNRVLELTSQILLLQANYQVLLAECQNFPQVLNEVEMLRGKLSELTEKSAEQLHQAQKEKIKPAASHAHAITDMQNMVNKIDTFYKPRIRELELENEEMKKMLPENETKKK